MALSKTDGQQAAAMDRWVSTDMPATEGDPP